MLELQSIPTNLESYEKRSIQMLRAAFRELGFCEDNETQRFCRIMKQLREDYDPREIEQNAFAKFQNQVVQTVPNIIEFVLSYSNGALGGIGYLTQGKPAATLPMSLTNLLANGFKLYLGEGGTQENAELIADVFALAFPNLEALADHSPMAQGMLWGFVPAQSELNLKLYLNTRLGVGGAHRDRVGAILERVGVDGLDLYDRIYEASSDASFHGLGIDLFQEQSARVKLYTRIPRSHLVTEVRRIAEGAPAEEIDAMVFQCENLVKSLDGPLLADDVELAIGIQPSTMPTFKCTAFFATDAKSNETPLNEVRAYLGGLDYDTILLDKMAEAAGAGLEKAAMENHPVHGVGIELGRGDIPKVNLYLRPLI